MNSGVHLLLCYMLMHDVYAYLIRDNHEWGIFVDFRQMYTQFKATANVFFKNFDSLKCERHRRNIA